jgi:hypothetical protein
MAHTTGAAHCDTYIRAAADRLTIETDPTPASTRTPASVAPRLIELADSDDALKLPPGTSAKVIRQVYGAHSRDPADRTTKLLQHHTGEFETVAIPDYSDWTGRHIPAMRVIAASFCRAGLLPDADKEAST